MPGDVAGDPAWSSSRKRGPTRPRDGTGTRGRDFAASVLPARVGGRVGRGPFEVLRPRSRSRATAARGRSGTTTRSGTLGPTEGALPPSRHPRGSEDPLVREIETGTCGRDVAASVLPARVGGRVGPRFREDDQGGWAGVLSKFVAPGAGPGRRQHGAGPEPRPVPAHSARRGELSPKPSSSRKRGPTCQRDRNGDAWS